MLCFRFRRGCVTINITITNVSRQRVGRSKTLSRDVSDDTGDVSLDQPLLRKTDGLSRARPGNTILSPVAERAFFRP